MSMDFTYQYNTTNKSFLETHLKLKARGTKNNKFFLILYNKNLLNIDPHSPDLTTEEKSQVLAEIKMNPWYYFREVIRILVSGGTVPFKLHLGNLSALFLLLKSVNIIEILPRQQGKTIAIASLFTYLYHFVVNNSKIIFSNKSLGDSILNLERFKKISEKLPKWLIQLDKKDIDNKMDIKQHLLNNSISALPTAVSPENADKLGKVAPNIE